VSYSLSIEHSFDIQEHVSQSLLYRQGDSPMYQYLSCSQLSSYLISMLIVCTSVVYHVLCCMWSYHSYSVRFLLAFRRYLTMVAIRMRFFYVFAAN